jgi:CheY-like chemotaxis protein
MKKKHILLIEDNPDDEMLTVRAFEKIDFVGQLKIARDGVEALDYVFRRGAYSPETALRPDLILLDLKLPKIDGKEVLKQIRRNPETKYIPVVVLTSSIEESDIRTCYELTGNSYIRKPIDFQQFKTHVEKICEYWLELNHAVPEAKRENRFAANEQ